MDPDQAEVDFLLSQGELGERPPDGAFSDAEDVDGIQNESDSEPDPESKPSSTLFAQHEEEVQMLLSLPRKSSPPLPRRNAEGGVRGLSR